jgi:FxsC-like protein
VHFVIAAGTRDEMRVVRQDVGFYGERQEDWAPYHPSLAQSLAARASEIAAERLFGSEVVPIGAVSDQVELAQERNEIVVLLLDSWVLGLESFRRMLARFDQVEESAVAVLVPASREDVETSEQLVKLRGGVLRAFPHCARRTLAHGDRNAHPVRRRSRGRAGGSAKSHIRQRADLSATCRRARQRETHS